MVASPALDISRQRPVAFLGLRWWKAAPGAVPKGTQVKSCSQVSAMATYSPLGWTRLRFYPAPDRLCDTSHPSWMRQPAITSSGPQLIAPFPVPTACPAFMERDPVPSHGDQAVTLPLAALCDPSTHHPQGKGEMVSPADADRVPWTPKERGRKDHPGHLAARSGEILGAPGFSIFV